jgi:tetratricopeptide (TPR) repeat protein
VQAQEFVRRFKNLLEDPDNKFVFFLGAGCSVSSGIPAVNALVRQWMPKLKVFKTGNELKLEEWIGSEFTNYEKNNPASSYGKVIEKLFLTKQDRQKEIEKLTEGKNPGFGYAVLSQIISGNTFNGHCNTVLTTNFDDMVADALYLYTNKKPLVVSHESLVGFVKINSTRPLVIKLHGDAKLSPKNTEQETKTLDDSVKTVIKNMLSEVGIVFIGYGGNDKSIVNILNNLKTDSLPGGIWWINSEKPNNEMGKWLEERNATWVKHHDFDELMLLFLNELSLEHPEKKRFDKLIKTYFDAFDKLKTGIESKPDTDDSKSLKEAIDIASEKIIENGDFSYAIVGEAKIYEKSDPARADTIFQKGLKKFNDDSWFKVRYADFLVDILKDYDKAEEFYNEAFIADPNYASGLRTYADFLVDILKDYDKAEGFYNRSIEADPNDFLAWYSYARFMKKIRKDYDKAEGFYNRSIEADPNNGFPLCTYANFMVDIRKDYDKAEGFYNRSIEADPNDAWALSDYAEFVKNIRKDDDKAEVLSEKYYQLMNK